MRGITIEETQDLKREMDIEIAGLLRNFSARTGVKVTAVDVRTFINLIDDVPGYLINTDVRL